MKTYIAFTISHKKFPDNLIVKRFKEGLKEKLEERLDKNDKHYKFLAIKEARCKRIARGLFLRKLIIEK